MAGIDIKNCAILDLAGKITVFIPEGKINPFTFSKSVDIVIMYEKDYVMNEKRIQSLIGENTKIFFI